MDMLGIDLNACQGNSYRMSVGHSFCDLHNDTTQIFDGKFATQRMRHELLLKNIIITINYGDDVMAATPECVTASRLRMRSTVNRRTIQLRQSLIKSIRT
jgi:hypothetical protein